MAHLDFQIPSAWTFVITKYIFYSFQLKNSGKVSERELSRELEDQKREFARREAELQDQLEEALEQGQKATSMMKDLRQNKHSMENEVEELQRRLGQEDKLKRRLTVSEVWWFIHRNKHLSY